MVKSLEDIGLLEVPAHPEPQAVTDQQFGDAFERMQRNQQGMRGLLDRLKAQQALDGDEVPQGGDTTNG